MKKGHELNRPRTKSYSAVRSLKIEAEGDYWKRLIKSKIRLAGRWLEQAGFRPGHRVRVVCVAPGIIELRFLEALTTHATSQPMTVSH